MLVFRLLTVIFLFYCIFASPMHEPGIWMSRQLRHTARIDAPVRDSPNAFGRP